MDEQSSPNSVLTQDMRYKEYTEAASAFRHYSGLRFAILAVFFALLGGTVQSYIAATQMTPRVMYMIFSTKTIALVMTLAFFFFEYRVQSYIKFFEGRLKDLESQLGFKLLASRWSATGMTWLKTPYITLSIYLLTTIFWLTSFFVLP